MSDWLNTCGLKSRQLYPEFCSFVNKYDIIGFQETKLDSLDTVTLDNFNLHFKNRKQFMKRKSGGICLAVKKSINRFVTVLETNSKLVLWFVVSKLLTKSEDILYGVVYVPPENSVFSIDDPFEEIQNELNSYTDKYSSICIFGDWNARTKDFQDYITADFDILHENNLDDLFYEFENELSNFDNSHVHKNRINCDSSCNTYGYKFIDFYKIKIILN